MPCTGQSTSASRSSGTSRSAGPTSPSCPPVSRPRTSRASCRAPGCPVASRAARRSEPSNGMTTIRSMPRRFSSPALLTRKKGVGWFPRPRAASPRLLGHGTARRSTDSAKAAVWHSRRLDFPSKTRTQATRRQAAGCSTWAASRSPWHGLHCLDRTSRCSPWRRSRLQTKSQAAGRTQAQTRQRTQQGASNSGNLSPKSVRGSWPLRLPGLPSC